jgi:hypothetical protein
MSSDVILTLLREGIDDNLMRLCEVHRARSRSVDASGRRSRAHPSKPRI